jgi:hypothetical protein
VGVAFDPTVVPRGLADLWQRFVRYVASVPVVKLVTALPNGDPIVVNGTTVVAHNERQIPRAAWAQSIGTAAAVGVVAVDARVVVLTATAPTTVHLFVVL